MAHRFDPPEESEPLPETGLDSPSSGDDIYTTAPSPKKRKGIKKKVVVVPIGDVEGSKSKGETYPPSDSWAWRKYGQKPIKGSPYPRKVRIGKFLGIKVMTDVAGAGEEIAKSEAAVLKGYYRCSSSKGCPARKQVERSRVDPTKVIVTYAHDHNHAAKLHPSAAANDGAPTESDSKLESAFAGHPDLDLDGDYGQFGWFDDVASTTTRVLESPIFDLDDVAMRDDEDDEDESLFADLGELPECSLVFRPRGSAIQCGGITG